jgi:hypothetical protein
MEGIVYSLNQIIALNHGKVGNNTFFDDSLQPKKTFESYNNPHNTRLCNTGKTKKQYVKSAAIYSDDRIIDDVQRIINNVTTDRINQPISHLNMLTIPEGQTVGIAKVFHMSMIRCDYLIEKYLDLLCNFRNKNIEYAVLRVFINNLIAEFMKPHVFTDLDSDVELGSAKTKRWRIVNSTIIARLTVLLSDKGNRFHKYRAGLEPAKISKRFLGHLFSLRDPIDLNVITVVWPILKNVIPDSDRNIYLSKLRKLATDKTINKIMQTKIIAILPAESDSDSDSGEDSDLDILKRFG